MKNLIVAISILIGFVACKQNNTKKQFNLSALPAEWIRLTKTDTGYIIYNSCDAGNLLFSITYKPQPSLLMHGQQEDDSLDILDCYQVTNDTVILHARNRVYNKFQDVKFIWSNKEKQLGHFISIFPDGGRLDQLFVSDKKQKIFPVYNQPCRECWGDECDSIVNKTTSQSVKSDTLKGR